MAAVVDGHDVAVVQAGGRLRLDAKAFEELGVGGQARLEHLDGHEPAEAFVLGEVDVGHPAAAERESDAVPTFEHGRQGGGLWVAV